MNLLEFINLNNLNLMSKGGPVMIILLGFSIFAFAIIFVKLIQFLSVALSSSNKIGDYGGGICGRYVGYCGGTCIISNCYIQCHPIFFFPLKFLLLLFFGCHVLFINRL